MTMTVAAGRRPTNRLYRNKASVKRARLKAFSFNHSVDWRQKTVGNIKGCEIWLCYGLAFLKAAESIRLDGGEMHENIVAGLTADKPVAFGVVKPLYCSLFQFITCYYLNFC